MSLDLRKHIYTAHVQWDAHEKARSLLNDETVITIEDYQMNMEVVYRENPTSLAYSSNKTTVALYPICIEYKTSEGKISKGAITFISDDKEHSTPTDPVIWNKYVSNHSLETWASNPSLDQIYRRLRSSI